MYGFMHDITAQCQEIDNCRVGSEAVIMHMWGSNLTFVCNAQECSVYSSACRNETTVVHMHDHEVEIGGVRCREKQEITQV